MLKRVLKSPRPAGGKTAKTGPGAPANGKKDDAAKAVSSPAPRSARTH